MNISRPIKFTQHSQVLSTVPVVHCVLCVLLPGSEDLEWKEGHNYFLNSSSLHSCLVKSSWLPEIPDCNEEGSWGSLV